MIKAKQPQQEQPTQEQAPSAQPQAPEPVDIQLTAFILLLVIAIATVYYRATRKKGEKLSTDVYRDIGGEDD